LGYFLFAESGPPSDVLIVGAGKRQAPTMLELVQPDTSDSASVRQQRTQLVRRAASELGFDKVGFAPAEHADPEDKLLAWLQNGFGEGMSYMHREPNVRQDPRTIVPGARSVIALAFSYYHPEHRPQDPVKIARYAAQPDYHRILKRRLRKLRRRILEMDPEATIHPSVDTSPVLEREWARRAGITWTGKSTMAIAPDLGTYTFLATLITTTDFDYDTPLPDRCGSCTRCLDACPTDAFSEPYVLDARRCIAYWTVEHRAPFPEPAPDLHGWAGGCDICQEVCPWNKFAKPCTDEKFRPIPALIEPDPSLFFSDDTSELARTLQGTPIQRTGAEWIHRNAKNTP
jgi:epoxyqueuosine reductase